MHMTQTLRSIMFVLFARTLLFLCPYCTYSLTIFINYLHSCYFLNYTQCSHNLCTEISQTYKGFLCNHAYQSQTLFVLPSTQLDSQLITGCCDSLLIIFIQIVPYSIISKMFFANYLALCNQSVYFYNIREVWSMAACFIYKYLRVN